MSLSLAERMALVDATKAMRLLVRHHQYTTDNLEGLARVAFKLEKKGQS